MKRISLLMNDDMYTSLLDYASVRSRTEIRRVSMGEIIRELISRESKLENAQPNLRAASAHKHVLRRQEVIRDSLPRTAF
jgi:hypothetical protein